MKTLLTSLLSDIISNHYQNRSRHWVIMVVGRRLLHVLLDFCGQTSLLRSKIDKGILLNHMKSTTNNGVFNFNFSTNNQSNTSIGFNKWFVWLAMFLEVRYVYVSPPDSTPPLGRIHWACVVWYVLIEIPLVALAKTSLRQWWFLTILGDYGLCRVHKSIWNKNYKRG